MLAALQLAHVQAIAFENLDSLLDSGVRLDLESLEAKLMRGRRGGYCFEQNLLFRAVLRALGFEATCLAARVYLDRPADAPVPVRTHLALRVVVDGASHLVDVGFGGMSPTGPIAFATGDAQATPHGPYRIRPAGDARDLEACIGDTWTLLYRYGLDTPADGTKETRTLEDAAAVGAALDGIFGVAVPDAAPSRQHSQG